MQAGNASSVSRECQASPRLSNKKKLEEFFVSTNANTR
jgi:hypothetical protein